MRLPLAGNAPNELIPAIASADKDNRQLNLLLVHSADDHLQGVVRLNGTLYPALPPCQLTTVSWLSMP